MSVTSTRACSSQAAPHSPIKSLWAFVAHPRGPEPSLDRELSGRGIRQARQRLADHRGKDASDRATVPSLQASSANPDHTLRSVLRRIVGSWEAWHLLNSAVSNRTTCRCRPGSDKNRTSTPGTLPSGGVSTRALHCTGRSESALDSPAFDGPEDTTKKG